MKKSGVASCLLFLHFAAPGHLPPLRCEALRLSGSGGLLLSASESGWDLNAGERQDGEGGFDSVVDLALKRGEEIMQRRLRDALSQASLQPREASLVVRRAVHAFIEAQEAALGTDDVNLKEGGRDRKQEEENSPMLFGERGQPSAVEFSSALPAVSFSLEGVWKSEMDSVKDRLSDLKKKASEKVKKTAEKVKKATEAASVVGSSVKEAAEQAAKQVWNALKGLFNSGEPSKTNVKGAAQTPEKTAKANTSAEDATTKGMDGLTSSSTKEETFKKNIDQVTNDSGEAEEASETPQENVLDPSIEQKMERDFEKAVKSDKDDWPREPYAMGVRVGTDMEYEPKPKEKEEEEEEEEEEENGSSSVKSETQ